MNRCLESKSSRVYKSCLHSIYLGSVRIERLGQVCTALPVRGESILDLFSFALLDCSKT